MDISLNAILPIRAVDAIARDGLGDDISGVSVGTNTRIHLLNDSPTNQGIAGDILNHFASLTLTADKTTMTEGDADPVISSNDPAIATDTEVKYLVLLDGYDYAEGTATVIAGGLSLNLLSPIAGIYDIYVYRRLGNHASGSITIIVSEV